MSRWLSFLLFLGLLAALPACSFVKPYQRSKLSHPSMASGRLVGPGEAHVHAVHEGATGGDVGAEASCGCN
ncbi:MAG: DUF4266 domain-containing protein [Polyangiaceae bacterium]